MENKLMKIAHEVKNPLAVCQGYLEMIDVHNQEKCQKYLDIVKKEMKHALDILNDALKNKGDSISKEYLDINLLLEEIYDEYKEVLEKEKIDLTKEIKDKEYIVFGNYCNLKQVITNLVKNAVEAKKEEHKLEINLKATTKVENVIIEIKDNGKGMSKKCLQKLGKSCFTTKEEGNGIGSNTIQEIIEKHHGKISYRSKVDGGTIVKVILPLYCNV